MPAGQTVYSGLVARSSAPQWPSRGGSASSSSGAKSTVLSFRGQASPARVYTQTIECRRGSSRDIAVCRVEMILYDLLYRFPLAPTATSHRLLSASLVAVSCTSYLGKVSSSRVLIPKTVPAGLRDGRWKRPGNLRVP